MFELPEIETVRRGLERERRPRLVGRPDVDEVERMRERLDSAEVELGDLAHRLEDGAELLGEAVGLLVTQVESGERGDVQHLFSRYGHVLILTKREGPFRGPRRIGSERGQTAGMTFAACAPFGPCTTFDPASAGNVPGTPMPVC